MKDKTSWTKRAIQMISVASGLITILAFAGITAARDLTARIVPWVQGVDRSGLRNDAFARVAFLTLLTAALAAVGVGLLVIGLMYLINGVTGESIDFLFGGVSLNPSVLWVYALLPAPLAGLWYGCTDHKRHCLMSSASSWPMWWRWRWGYCHFGGFGACRGAHAADTIPLALQVPAKAYSRLVVHLDRVTLLACSTEELCVAGPDIGESFKAQMKTLFV
jgi:hypothetical protein